MMRTFLRCGLFVAMIFGAPSLAQAQLMLVGCTGTVFGNAQPSNYVDIDLNSGAASNIRNIGIQYMGGIAAQPVTGTLFGLTTFVSTPANALVRIDKVTGLPTLVGGTSLDIVEGDLAFNPVNGQLFGVKDLGISGNQRNLFRLDPNTGAATIVGNTASMGDLSSLAFNSLGTLYSIDAAGMGNSLLQTIDPLTGAITSSVQMNMNLGSTIGMAFNPTTGIAYVADGGDASATNLLFSLDVSTGLLTSIGPTGVFGGISGLAFITVPEPSSITLIVMSVALLSCQRRHQCRKRDIQLSSPLG
jgi:hypothetical protein